MFCHQRRSDIIADPHGSTISAFYWVNTAAINPLPQLPAICYPAGDNSFSYSVGNSWELCKAHRPTTSGRYDSDSSMAVQIVPSADQRGCQAINKHSIPSGEDCYNNFMKVISQCVPASGGGKVGVWKENSKDGCWDWWMWGRELYE